MKENNSILHTKKIQNHKNHWSTRVNEISYCQMDAEKWKEGAIRGREEKKTKNTKTRTNCTNPAQKSQDRWPANRKPNKNNPKSKSERKEKSIKSKDGKGWMC